MGQTIAESIWEEGRLKGRAEGELETLRRTLRQLLTARFAAVPEALLGRIEGCGDVDRLSAAVLRVSDIATPEEIGL
ncbi:MAG TPA: hypothetical protein VFA18_15385 [Gemmataceae bacterium]|nr:hypothetical protein [Gemmataceae bacterium]